MAHLFGYRMNGDNMRLLNYCMITNGSRVLVQDKVKVHGWEGLTFPGGKVEPHESFDAAVRREVLEETGLTLGRITFCGLLQWSYEDGRREVVFCYKSDDFTGELIRETPEGPVFWMEWDDFMQAEGHAEFIDAYLRVLLDENVTEAYCHYVPGEKNEFQFFE